MLNAYAATRRFGKMLHCTTDAVREKTLTPFSTRGTSGVSPVADAGAT